MKFLLYLIHLLLSFMLISKYSLYSPSQILVYFTGSTSSLSSEKYENCTSSIVPPIFNVCMHSLTYDLFTLRTSVSSQNIIHGAPHELMQSNFSSRSLMSFRLKFVMSKQISGNMC